MLSTFSNNYLNYELARRSVDQLEKYCPIESISSSSSSTSISSQATLDAHEVQHLNKSSSSNYFTTKNSTMSSELSQQAHRSSDILNMLQLLTRRRDELRSLDRHLFDMMSDCLMQLKLYSNGCPNVQQAIENFYRESQNFSWNHLVSYLEDAKTAPSSITNNSIKNNNNSSMLNQAIDLTLALDGPSFRQLKEEGDKIKEANQHETLFNETLPLQSVDASVNLKKRRLLGGQVGSSPSLDPIKSFNYDNYDLKRKSPLENGHATIQVPIQQLTPSDHETICSKLDVNQHLNIGQHPTSIIANLDGQLSLIPALVESKDNLLQTIFNMTGNYGSNNEQPIIVKSLPATASAWQDSDRRQAASIFDQSLANSINNYQNITQSTSAQKLQLDTMNYISRLQTAASGNTQPVLPLGCVIPQTNGATIIENCQPPGGRSHELQQLQLDHSQHPCHMNRAMDVVLDEQAAPRVEIAASLPGPPTYPMIGYNSTCTEQYQANKSSFHVDKANQLVQKLAFRCHVCGSRFEDRHRLQQHLSIHLNLHPSWFEEKTIKETMAQYELRRGDYLCPECQFRFDTTAEFDRHMHQLHGDKPHFCELCRNQENKQVSFRYFRQLLTHLRSHCFLYSCRFVPECKQTANRKDYLKLHILKHHLNNKLPEQYTICCH